MSETSQDGLAARNEADIDTAEVLLQRMRQEAKSAPLPSWLQEMEDGADVNLGEPVDLWHSAPIPTQAREWTTVQVPEMLAPQPLQPGDSPKSGRAFADLKSGAGQAEVDVPPVRFNVVDPVSVRENQAADSGLVADEGSGVTPTESFRETPLGRDARSIDAAGFDAVLAEGGRATSLPASGSGDGNQRLHEPVAPIAHETQAEVDPVDQVTPMESAGRVESAVRVVRSGGQPAPESSPAQPGESADSDIAAFLSPDMRELHPEVQVTGSTPTPSQGIPVQSSRQVRSSLGVSPSALRRSALGGNRTSEATGAKAGQSAGLPRNSSASEVGVVSGDGAVGAPGRGAGLLAALGFARRPKSQLATDGDSNAVSLSGESARNVPAGEGAKRGAGTSPRPAAKPERVPGFLGFLQRIPFKVWSFLAILVLLAIAVLYVLFATQLLAVKNIEVSGNSRITTAQIEQATEKFKNVPLAKVSLGDAALNAAGIRGIESATAQRQWPNTLHFDVVERIPSAVYQAADGLVLLDKTGYVLGPVDSVPKGMPTIKVEPYDGKVLAQSMAIYQLLPPGIKPQVTGIGATGLDAIYFDLSGNRRVIWGSVDHTEAKLAVLPTVLGQPNMAIYDISAPESVVTRAR